MPLVDELAQRVITPVAEHRRRKQLIGAVLEPEREPMRDHSDILTVDAGQPEYWPRSLNAPHQNRHDDPDTVRTCERNRTTVSASDCAHRNVCAASSLGARPNPVSFTRSGYAPLLSTGTARLAGAGRVPVVSALAAAVDDLDERPSRCRFVSLCTSPTVSSHSSAS